MSSNPSLPGDPLWYAIREQAAAEAEREAVLASYLHATILTHDSLESAIAYHLAGKLDGPTVKAMTLREVFDEAFAKDPEIGRAMRADLAAVRDRDPACGGALTPLLYFKGFHALASHRIAHWLWQEGRQFLALFFQSRMAQLFDVDIHPAARIGHGVFIDHGTGIVIGETSVVGNDVSMLQGVTLGGTGKEQGDRHPKIHDAVLIGAGAKVLGNVHVGHGAKIGAGSVVLMDVPPYCTAAGVPATLHGDCAEAAGFTMDHSLQPSLPFEGDAGVEEDT
ncbi:MAG: serine O-acetyltransferase [Deltaproteobacteria bacterium]|nr:serine O-acetyltransferase [Deltaproteobacteria bacterium]MBW2396211.1 serine O-acetyltransferase [Deltaproteobacteria bacterium]